MIEQKTRPPPLRSWGSNKVHRAHCFPSSRNQHSRRTCPWIMGSVKAENVGIANSSRSRPKLPDAPRTPRLTTDDPQHLPLRRAGSGAVSPEDGRPRPTAAQELRELLENHPSARRTTGQVESRSQAHGRAQFHKEGLY